ncbi:hypothetical protein BDFB_014082, partial [Asbolus verrucosus]
QLINKQAPTWGRCCPDSLGCKSGGGGNLGNASFRLHHPRYRRRCGGMIDRAPPGNRPSALLAAATSRRLDDRLKARGGGR